MIRRAYGEVYVARDKNHEDVAVKRIKLNTTNNAIRRECEILGECNNPFIVRYYDYLIVDGELWVVITHTVHH